MKAIEETFGTLTDWEQELKAEFHVTRKTSWRWRPDYRVVLDRNSGAVLGYAFLLNNVEIYDRSGKLFAAINNEAPVSTSLLSPMDFVAGGIASWVGKRFLGHGTRSTAAAVESNVSREAVDGTVAGVRARKLPQWQVDQTGSKYLGYTDDFGDIYINPAIKYGTKDFYETVFHERVHQYFTARFGKQALWRTGKAKALYHRSHFMRYTEEALAETWGTLSLRRGLAFPIKEGYVTPWRLGLEGSLVLGGYAGSWYGSYKLSEHLFAPSGDR
jgi:hypothetical protein